MTRDARERGHIKLPAISLARLTSGWSGPASPAALQRIYAINFFAGVAFAGGFAGTAALSLLALVEVSTDAVIYASMGSLAIFLPVNLLIWRLNRGRTQTSLEFPVPHRVFGRVSGTLVALIVVSLVYCVFAWPAAPIRPSASGYVDKRGQRFTESAYLGFRRWEASYFAVWSAAALLGVVALPFRRSAKNGDTHSRGDRESV